MSSLWLFMRSCRDQNLSEILSFPNGSETFAEITFISISLILGINDAFQIMYLIIVFPIRELADLNSNSKIANLKEYEADWSHLHIDSRLVIIEQSS